MVRANTVDIPPLRGLLQAAARDEAAREQAMHALHGVDLWAVTWPLDPTTLRTLTNSSGETALPIFTARALLEEAAMRFGWQLPDGTLPARLTRIEELLRESEAAGVPLLIVDIASDHALELDEHDRKVLEQGPPRTSSRPPAGVPEAPEFGLANTLRPEEQGSASSRPPVMARPGPGNEAERDRPSSRPPVAVGGARFAAMGSAVPTGLRRALREVLRSYPEVQWANLVLAARGPGATLPALGLRLEPGQRSRVAELRARLREASDEHGAMLDIMLLDDSDRIRAVQQLGTPIYPWTRKDGETTA